MSTSRDMDNRPDEESKEHHDPHPPPVDDSEPPSDSSRAFRLFNKPSERVISARAVFGQDSITSYRHESTSQYYQGSSLSGAEVGLASTLSQGALRRDPSLAGGIFRNRSNPSEQVAQEQAKSYFNVHSSLADQDKSFFAKQKSNLQTSMVSGGSSFMAPTVDSNDQVGMIGGAWRGALSRLMIAQFSEVNARQMSRILQLFIPFQTGLEALLLCRLIEAFDKEDMEEVRKHLQTALKNRNVSRIVVSNLSTRFDWFWHIHSWMTYNRLMDGWGQLPIVGITGFPATENFPATRNHALASIFRVLLGEGNWVTRVLTGGREGLVTDNPDNTAQNLAAESNNFELANNSQYGTTYGRNKTNDFRFHHRLPTDESLVRTFVTSPQATTVNNGVMHVLWGLARHWHNMLSQQWGNFAHQRMEQLDPFETLRFHIPQMLLLLTNLRGRNRWDSEYLADLIKDLQHLGPSENAEEPIKEAQMLAHTLQSVLPKVCAGVTAWLEPFDSWVSAIIESLDRIQQEADQVREILFSVETGVRVGFDCMCAVNWSIPDDPSLKKAILHHVHELKKVEKDRFYRPTEINPDIPSGRITSALNLTTPRDKRTFIELVANGLEDSKPAKLLLGRNKTLLQRELRRHAMNSEIQERSVGDSVTGVLERDEWYWIDNQVYCCLRPLNDGSEAYTFMHVASNVEEDIDITAKEIRRYNYVAESINRAQKAYMSIELYHGRTFKYSAFMEFPSLRIALLRLATVAQMACETLDDARLNVLKEIQRSRAKTAVDPKELEVGKTYFIYDDVTEAYKPFVYSKKMTINPKARIVATVPQSTAVIGGGPTGLMTVLHCTENCLASDGVMKLYEARDAFPKGGSTFERAQIVRLDARWIAMMRYHCGTSFEDIYIPLVGETDSQLGNSLPTQGFVEITIKDLEGMLHGEITRLWSKGLVSIYTESKASYDPDRNQVLKAGDALKAGDLILRDDGMEHEITWKVKSVEYAETVAVDDLELGKEYGVWVPALKAIKPFKLTCIDLEGDLKFKALDETYENIVVDRSRAPSIYPPGTASSAHGKVTAVKLQSTKVGEDGADPTVETVGIEEIRDKKFALDVGYTHIFEAIGKPKASKKHLCITTQEPYGVCCIQGLKVSLGMHNFGETRFGDGLVDDIRSHTDQNTRIIGDFTKMVRVSKFVSEMAHIMNTDLNWAMMFEKVIKESKFPQLNEQDPVVKKMRSECLKLAGDAPNWRRKTVQTRFFETGDNYYLGMEFTREYDAWKESLGDALVATLRINYKDGSKKRDIDKLRFALLQLVDKLRYEGVLETIRKGDVYNPGARHRVPRLHLIDSLLAQQLSSLPELEAFRLESDPQMVYELVMRKGNKHICRTVEGRIVLLNGGKMVLRESNLTRGPDGNAESKVSIAAFPVGHYVNHRTMIELKDGHVIAFGGDEQSTPHFMRYSGLTGACINCMSFNVFLGKAIIGIDFNTRYKEYSLETNWSNGEVVQRGTGANYGEDGFLRPGFPYRAGVDYLRDKMEEYRATGQSIDDMLSRDWKIKFAAALIPRGLEHNEKFLGALKTEWHNVVFTRLVKDLEADKNFDEKVLKSLKDTNEEDDADHEAIWLLAEEKSESGFYCRRVYMTLLRLIDFAQELRSEDLRISSSLFHQLKAVDHIVDDFAVEAQSVANALTQSAALAASSLALSLVHETGADVASACLAAVNIVISFGTMANIARYKTRNEESRISFYHHQFNRIKQAVFSLASSEYQMGSKENPFVEELLEKVDTLRDQFRYYNIAQAEDFDAAWEELTKANFENDAVRKFQDKLLTEFVARTFHENSYVQQSLVDIHSITNRFLAYDERLEKVTGKEEAAKLFGKLQKFQPRLKDSLQEGHIQWGFLKKRKFTQWDICAVVSYLRGLFYFRGIERSIGNAPVEVETAYLSRKVQELSAMNGGFILNREHVALETCYWAHRESQIASCVFVTGFFTFIASILFTIARIGSISVLVDAAFWTALPSSLGAILASMHLYRKTRILLGLVGKVNRKKKMVQHDEEAVGNFRVVLSATWHQIGLTLFRFVAAIVAAFLLPYSLKLNIADTESDIPGYLAAVSAGSAVLSVVYFFVVEYVVRYNLPVDLGPFICRLFESEIWQSFDKTAIPPLGCLDTPKKMERDHWEYAARDFLHDYRFDTVFAADRFGQILQSIQGGLPARPGDV